MAPLALSRQTYPNFEVVLVDDGSTDESACLVLKEYSDRLPSVRLIRNEKRLGLRPARNLGVRSATGDIIITLDIHTTFDQEFVKRIVDAFNQEVRVGAVGSLVLTYGDEWYHRGMRAFERCLFSARRSMRRYNWIAGGAAAYSAKALREVGYLSESEVAEDVDASWRLTEKGWKVATLENNIVFHKVPRQSFKDFSERMFFGGIRTTLLISKHRNRGFYPQNLLRVLLFPFLFLLLFIQPLLVPLLLLAYCIGLTLCLIVLFKQNVRDSLCATFISLIIVSVSSLGMLYDFFARLERRLRLTKVI